MSNYLRNDDEAPREKTSPIRRRRLWLATGVAGLTGAVSLAGVAYATTGATGAHRLADVKWSTAQRVSGDDGGKKADADEQNERDQKGDGKEKGERGEVQEVPCDEDALIDAIREANRDGGGTLKLARDCTYKLHEAIDKTATGLPTIKEEITIKGEGSTIKRDSEDGFRIFRVAEGGDLTLKDLTVTGGNVGENKKPVKYVPRPMSRPTHDKDSGEDGGGLLVQRGGEATLVQTKFTLNSADDNGGAIANFGEVEVQNSTLDNNHAGDNGGAIFNAGVLEVEGSNDGKGGESRITNNTAGENGGGIANGTKRKHHGPRPGGTDLVGGRDGDHDDDHDDGKAGTVEIEKTLIEGNKADKNGGGISSNGGFVDVSWTSIDNNTASDNGGGIYAVDTVLTVERSKLTKNHAGKDGGGIYNVSSEEREHPNAQRHDKDKDKGGTATVTDSEILENSAGRFGGGIFNGEPVEEHNGHPAPAAQPNHEDHEDFEATLTLRNTKIAKNFAGENGGGIYNNEGKVTLTNSHVTENKAQVENNKDTEDIAGGIFNNDGKVTLDDDSTVTRNDPRNCAGDPIEGCDD
ncbi:polymorphic outer membrane protein repeat-containing protein [Micromonospora rhizosphaerae]|uniref:Polymorphic outer membrane protein repeat-containing protein n=1 Tax=Micromonospora rhizosphaerae TaxID=568872 RepID=A0A1C6T5E8_9ACTN|nr:hypothetical protein [Micromonospora rhizosphaerae]SCL36917.1 polymorphic outer membrane protein repeat-containing protein [Micromonospora rhizosphaerae]